MRVIAALVLVLATGAPVALAHADAAVAAPAGGAPSVRPSADAVAEHEGVKDASALELSPKQTPRRARRCASGCTLILAY